MNGNISNSMKRQETKTTAEERKRHNKPRLLVMNKNHWNLMARAQNLIKKNKTVIKN